MELRDQQADANKMKTKSQHEAPKIQIEIKQALKSLKAPKQA